MAYLLGKGTLLKLNGTTIADRVTIEGPSRSVETTDVTTLDSSAREFAATITDNGEVTFTCNYGTATASHQSLEALMVTPANEDWTLIYNDATLEADRTNDDFEGILTKFDLKNMSVDGVIQAECTIKISGSIERS